MLRYLYLLCLLVCIELTFSYDYIENPVRNLRGHGRHDRRVKRNREKKHLVRQEYDFDKSPVEFDVASFIQCNNDAGDAPADDGYRVKSNKRRHYNAARDSDYSALMESQNSNKKLLNNADYNEENSSPEISLNALLSEDTVNSNSVNLNELNDIPKEKPRFDKQRKANKHEAMNNMQQEAPSHHPDKKCAFKHMKFPFFSHEKPASLKPKKTKKRKLFSFTTCMETKNDGKGDREINVSEDPTTQFKIKRSYLEKLCPACKNRYTIEKYERPKKDPKKIFHNTRQFYENLPDDQLKENIVSKVSIGDVLNNKRKKRGEDCKDRQLKELDEVQKKIDNVKIQVPMSDESPGLPTFLN